MVDSRPDFRDLALSASSSEIWLIAIVTIAFTVEAALGFGATVVTVALGSLLLPLDQLLPAFVPLNMCLSAYLSARYFRAVRWRMLLTEVLPVMLLGLPFGIFALARIAEAPLKLAFGISIIALSAVELLRPRVVRGSGIAVRPLEGKTAFGVLFLGGVVHGAFATGGPLAVYVVSRKIVDKTSFRATLSVLWLLLNVVLVSSYVVMGKVDTATLETAAPLALGLSFGLVVGEVLHRRVPERIFRVLVFAMLGIAGAVIVARAHR